MEPIYAHFQAFSFFFVEVTPRGTADLVFLILKRGKQVCTPILDVLNQQQIDKIHSGKLALFLVIENLTVRPLQEFLEAKLHFGHDT